MHTPRLTRGPQSHRQPHDKHSNTHQSISQHRFYFKRSIIPRDIRVKIRTNQSYWSLARRPVHLPAPHHVQVQVVDSLCPLRTVVDHHPVALAQALLSSNLSSHHQQVAQQLGGGGGGEEGRGREGGRGRGVGGGGGGGRGSGRGRMEQVSSPHQQPTCSSESSESERVGRGFRGITKKWVGA